MLLLVAVPTLFSALVSCGGEDDDPVVDPDMTLTLRRTSIANGAEVKAHELNDITLYYNNPVEVSPSAEITLNGSKLSAHTSTQSKLEIVVDLGPLTEGTSYQLQVPEGSIVCSTDPSVTAPALTLSFTTEAAIETSIDALSDADAISSAKNVYDFLRETYGQKCLSASMANISWNFDEANLVYRATGKYPAIATMDYIHILTLTDHSPFNGWRVNYDDLSEVEAWWNNNGLLAAGWHWNMPANEASIDNPNGYTCTPGSGTTGDKPTTCAKPSNVMKEGTWEHRIADQDLQVMASLLKALQEKGIPLIFRPLHEASGNTYGPYAGAGAWFWWGAEGAEVYKKLWIYMHDYFEQAGIHNLIWVWTSQNNGDTDWYPGDAYVDVIGQDIYNQQAESNATDYKRLQATYPNKMVTLSECGNVGLISDQWSQGARWSYFMPWYQYDATSLDTHEHANTQWWLDAMTSPNVISRDEMPNLK